MNLHRRIYFALFTVATTGCAHVTGLRPKAPFAAVGPGALVIAHRGGSLEAPENTLSSITNGVAAGSDWQELDVALSRDDRVVVIHDTTVNRTTNGQGLVAGMPVAQLTALRAGSPRWDPGVAKALKNSGVEPPDFGDRYDDHIPTLAQILEVPGARLMIELKKSPRPARLAAAVVRTVQDARASDRVILGSFEFELVDAVHQLDPSLPLVGIISSPGALERMLDLPISVLAADHSMLSSAIAAAPPGVAVWAWTAYTPAEAEAMALKGAHGVITDAPSAVLRAFRPPERAGL